MTVRVLALQSGVTDLTGHRYHESAGFTQSTPGSARSGLIPVTGAADVSQVSAMEVNVAPFAAWVDGGSSAQQAGYNVVSDDITPITIAAGEASVARTDRIWVVVYQNAYDSSGKTLGAVEYAKGQASGQPQPLPSSAILLWEFSVPAGASASSGGVAVSSFVDKRTYTAAAGGIIPVMSQAERDAIPSPYKGMTVWRADMGIMETWDNAWRAQGVPSLTSVSVAPAHISDPVDGQLIFARDTQMLYRWDASTAHWVLYNGSRAAWRTTDAPGITNTTMTSVGLAVPVVANAVYQLECSLVYNTPVAAGLQAAWSFPSGLSIPRYAMTGYINGSWTSGVTQDQTVVYKATAGYSGLDLHQHMWGIVFTGSTSGTLELKVSQNTANSTALIVRQGSFLRLTPVG